MREHLPDFGIRIEQIPEDPRAGRTRFETRRQPAIARAVQTEMAFLHHALRPDAIAQVGLVRIDLIRRDDGLGPVEAPRMIRTRGFAVAAADAPVVIHHHNAVCFLPRRLDRANVHARRMLALLALHRHVKLVRLRHGMIVMRIALLHVHRAFRHLEDANVALVRGPVVIVLDVARLRAFAAAIAHAEIECIAKLHARFRFVIRDGHVRAVLLLRLLFEPAQNDFEINRRELLVMFLQEILDGDVPRPLGQRRNGLGKRRRAQHRAQAFQHGSPGEAPDLRDGGGNWIWDLIHAQV